MTVYIVGGWQRCGTSMMMGALAAGGMTAAHDPDRTERMNERQPSDGFLPNADYFEMSREQYRAPDFPWAYRGKLVKLLQSAPLALPSFEYRVIFMRRDPAEILASYRAAFNDHPPSTPDAWAYWERSSNALAHLQNRRDVQVIELWYPQVLESPAKTFEMLSDMGWPIDAQSAAEAVKPDLRRFHENPAVPPRGWASDGGPPEPLFGGLFQPSVDL